MSKEKLIRMEFISINISVLLLVILATYLQNVQGEDCSPGRKCLTCPVGLPYHCTSCNKGFHLQRGGAYLSCEPCPTACMECDSMYSCTSCEIGRYGSLCRDVCGRGCINAVCDQHLGLCGCKQNFSGTLCDRCVDGNYGYEFDNCELKCPSTCKACHSDKNCTVCQDGYYGLTCDKLCPRGCYLGACTKNNGTCIGNKCSRNFQGLNCDQCATGLYGSNCNNSCPETCLSCSSNSSCSNCKLGYWGNVCQNNCSRGCHEISCLKETGVCTNKNCTEGFAGDMCDKCLFGLSGALCNMNETLTENSAESVQIGMFHRYMPVICLLLCLKELFDFSMDV